MILLLTFHQGLAQYPELKGSLSVRHSCRSIAGSRLSPLLSIPLVVLFSRSAAAQTADLSGTINDPSGAVIIGATLTVAKQESGVKETASSRERGLYRFPFLLPGSYVITVDAPGFQAERRSDVKLDPGQQARLDFVLAPARLKQQITVPGSPLSESPAVSTDVDPKLVAELPTNGRSFQTLIELAPGVVPTGGTTLAARVPPWFPGQLSVNGQRDTANYFSVDGVSANTAFPVGTVPGFDVIGSTHGIISMDDMQELKLQTSTTTADTGRAAGGQLEIVSRSGSNQFHGSAFDYFRNEALDANDWFANAAGQPRPALRRNDFGAVLGGPLLKNRTFFFFSYEGVRSLEPGVAKYSVPSVAARQQATGAIQDLLDAFPLPNGPEDPSSMLAVLTSVDTNLEYLDNTTLRIDHIVNQKLKVLGRYSEAPSNAKGRGGSEVDTSWVNFRSATLGGTLTISPRTLSDLRLNYSGNENGASVAMTRWGGAIPPPNSLLFPPFASPSSSLIFFNLGGPHFRVGTFSDNLQRQGNLVSNTSLVRGSHNVKFGADYRYLSPHYGPFKYRQAVFFPDIPTALTGIANEVDVWGLDSVTLGLHNLSLYGQDNWKLTPRFTLTYGLRWEFVPPPHAKGNVPLLTITGFPDLAALNVATPGTPLYNTTYTNFAPRVGAAYELFRAPAKEMVLRGGFGTYYDLGLGDVTDAAASFPHLRQSVAFQAPYPLSPDVAAPPPPAVLEPPYIGTFNAFVSDHALPRTYQWNLTLDQNLGSSQTLS
ncbi:MAG: TonB-dependent receptor, partial [Acidobacteria bacterium]|nr:TonB-dependent receptor [Acidobacteriota bacterium]